MATHQATCINHSPPWLFKGNGGDFKTGWVVDSWIEKGARVLLARNFCITTPTEAEIASIHKEQRAKLLSKKD